MAMDTRGVSETDRQVGERMRDCRLALGMSQTTMAERIGVTFQQVQKYEKGVNRVSAGRLRRIADVLAVSVASLIGDGAGAGGPSDQLASLLSQPGALNLLERWTALDPVTRNAILDLVTTLSKDGQAAAGERL